MAAASREHFLGGVFVCVLFNIIVVFFCLSVLGPNKQITLVFIREQSAKNEQAVAGICDDKAR